MAANLTADVIVVGGGVNGLATALELCALGVGNVTLLERHQVGAGQSGRAAGISRALVPHALAASWQFESQRNLLGFSDRFDVPVQVNQPGYLLVARASELELVEHGVRTAVEVGAHAEVIDASAALDLQPGLRRGDDVIYAFEPGAVHVDPMVVTQAMAVAARRHGVTICEDCAVIEVMVDAGRVTGVRAGDAIHNAPAVMIATSVWGRRQLAHLGIEVPVYPHRAEMAFFHDPLEGGHRLVRILTDSRSGLYLRPEGPRQMFVGWREGDFVRAPEDFVPQDPDNYRQTAEPARLRDMGERLTGALSFMSEGFVHRSYACVYDYTPDGQPILDADGPAGLYYALGFSGGGFSTASIVGRTMARYIFDGSKPPEIEWLRRARFEEGDTIEWSNAAPVAGKSEVQDGPPVSGTTDVERIRTVVEEINRETAGAIERCGFDFTTAQLEMFLAPRSIDEAIEQVRALATWMHAVNQWNHDGVTLTPVLVNYLAGAGDIESKLSEVDRLRDEVRKGRFDVDNPIQRDTEFHRFLSVCGEEQDGEKETIDDRYSAFTRLPALQPRSRQPLRLEGQHRVEARRIAYEAYGFLQFVRRFRSQTSRPVVVVGNDRYGRQWVVEPIESYLDDTQVLYPRVPSHKSFRLRVPHTIAPCEVRSGFHRDFVHRLNAETPHLIIADARNVGEDDMMRLSRGTRDYVNWFVVFNDLRAEGDTSAYADRMPLPLHHFGELKRWHQFEIVRRQIGSWVDPGEIYHVSMWAPEITEQAMLGDFRVPVRPVEYGSDEPQVVLANPVVYRTDDADAHPNLQGNRPYYFDGPERHVRHQAVIGFGKYGIETLVEGATTDEFVEVVQRYMREEIERLLTSAS